MTTASVHDHPALAGLTVFERGWLSSNNVLVHASEGEAGATLIDSGHVNHAAQTLALVRHALGEAPLARIVNTHLHSDHCGGNATLARALGARITIPPGLAGAVRAWAADALSYEATGQLCGRFEVHATLSAGEVLEAGGRRFEVIAAPGHDPHSVMLFDAAHGLLISADALWEQGFGVVFPEMEGEPGFEDVAAVLDTKVKVIAIDDQDRVAQFDEIDALRPSNIAEVALVNRVLAKPAGENPGGAFEIFSFEIAQAYSFDADQPLQTSQDRTLESSESALFGKLRYNPSKSFSLQAQAQYSTLFSGLDSTSLSGTARLPRLDLGLTWLTRYRPEFDTTSSDQVRLSFGTELVRDRLRFDGQINYDIENGEFQQQRYFLNYVSQCWSVRPEGR